MFIITIFFDKLGTMNQCTQIPKTSKEIKITLPDYKNSNCNLSNSILKNFGIKPLITIKGDCTVF